MKTKLSALLILTLLLGACASNPTAAPAESTELPTGEVTTAPVETAPAESSATENSEQAPTAREAIVAEIENEVVIRPGADGEFLSAEPGSIIQAGGALQTGDNGRARLDLNPEQTIIRIAPNSAFTLPELVEVEGEPKSTLNLFFGKIFVLLNGGSLDVQTPSGVASVRGSLLSVSFDPETEQIQAACLEGHCTLENEDGEEVDIPEGESGYIDENGEIEQFDSIDQDEVLGWIEEVDELGQFLGEIPNPENYENYDWYEEYTFNPTEYYGEQTTDDGSGYFVFDESILPDAEYYEQFYEENPTGGTEPAPEGSLTEPAPSEEATPDLGGGPSTEEPPTDSSGGSTTEEPPTDDTTGGGVTEEPTP